MAGRTFKSGSNHSLFPTTAPVFFLASHLCRTSSIFSVYLPRMHYTLQFVRPLLLGSSQALIPLSTIPQSLTVQHPNRPVYQNRSLGFHSPRCLYPADSIYQLRRLRNVILPAILCGFTAVICRPFFRVISYPSSQCPTLFRRPLAQLCPFTCASFLMVSSFHYPAVWTLISPLAGRFSAPRC